MKNGNNSAPARLDTFDPEIHEVTDVMPTATGEYLEEVRRATQYHLKLLQALTDNTDLPEEYHYDFGKGGHPYRTPVYVKTEPLHPYESWFW